MSKQLSSKRAQAREVAMQRRLENREWRRGLLDLVAAGHSYGRIADKAGVSVSTLKRMVQRALAERRPPEPAETFVALHRERLNKALQYTDLAMENGDPRAVAALVALLPRLDRYWGLQNAVRAARGATDGAHISTPNGMKSLETETGFPPLAATPARA
jgi:hypothetical protein